MLSRQFIALECPRSILHSSLDQIRSVLSTDADAYPPSQCTALVVQFPCPWNVCHFIFPTFHCLTVLSRDVLSILSPQILMSIIISLCPSRIHVWNFRSRMFFSTLNRYCHPLFLSDPLSPGWSKFQTWSSSELFLREYHVAPVFQISLGVKKLNMIACTLKLS